MNRASPLVYSEIKSQFLAIESWDQRYEYLIEIGKQLPTLDENFKTNDRIVKGCQSQVWLHADCAQGKVLFYADSDAIIVKGLVHLLIVHFQYKTPDEILSSNIEFFNELGFQNHLSPSRTNGVMSVIKQMKMYAFAFKIQNQGNAT